MLRPPFDVAADNYYGAPGAVIELVEYGDFQCKKCAAAFKEIKILQDITGNDLRFVFRHFPLVNLHPLSLEAAIASEAAAHQGKFWNMHNMLFQNQESLSRSLLIELAEDANMNMSAFESKREHESVFKKVLYDFESGLINNVTGTPAFFINGFPYTGSYDFRSLYKIYRYLSALKE